MGCRKTVQGSSPCAPTKIQGRGDSLRQGSIPCAATKFMSEMSRKYRPPKISRWDLEEGVRYIEPEPQTDFVGQPLEVGDIVVYARSVGRTAGLAIAKVIGMFTRVSPDGNQSHGVGIVLQDNSWYAQRRLRKQTTCSDQLIKLNLESIPDTVTKELLEA